MKKIGIFLLCLYFLCLWLTPNPNTFARDRVVMLIGRTGLCTGVEVMTKSRHRYTLTAKHCRVILEDNKVEAVLEDGSHATVEFVAVDPNSDLMILGPVGQKYMSIAEHTYPHEHIHTMTHGGGFPSYRTDGELLNEKEIRIDQLLLEMITTAPVIPGSSGGPYIDDSNHLVGIVSVYFGAGFSGMVRLKDIQAFLKLY